MMIGILASVSTDPVPVIGIGRYMPWDFPGDVDYFQRRTAGAVLIMGRKTWQATYRTNYLWKGFRPLEARKLIVVSSDRDLPVAKGVYIVTSVREAIFLAEYLSNDGHRDIFFVGGEKIYEAAMNGNFLESIELVVIPKKVETGGTDVAHFPSLDRTRWEEVSSVTHPNHNQLVIQTYKRRVYGSPEAHAEPAA